MNLNAEHLKSLSPGLVERLQKVLRQFEQGWTEQMMADMLPALKPDHVLRFPTVVEMTRLDMEHRWKTAAGWKLEHYLSEYPELGSKNTVPVYLIRAEYDARLASGDSVEVSEYARRFPIQFESFYKTILRSKEAAKAKARAESKAEPPPEPTPPPVEEKPKKPSSPAVERPKKTVLPSMEVVSEKPALLPEKPKPPKPAPAKALPPSAGKKSRTGLFVGLMVLAVVGLGAVGLWGLGVFDEPKKLASNTTTNTEEITDPKPEGKAPPVVPKTSGAVPGLTDPVESIIVKLDIGPGSETTEAVFLDLGLGFPLWLSPGSAIPATVPFGAVPQQSDANNTLEPGKTASFTFLAKGEPGRDALLTTPQLLAGLRVGDIRRAGFASLAEQDWTLAGFELIVNGKTLHSAKGLNLRPKQLQLDAQTKLGALTVAGGPAAQELAGLRELVQTGLASDAEKTRFAELERQSKPAPGVLEERALLERQLRGQSPWFQTAIAPNAEPKTVAVRRPKSFLSLFENTAFAQELVAPPKPDSPKNVRVSLVTDPGHEQSDTKNYVYFRVGGRKFLIGGPEFPLTSANGPQTIDLDLLAGPLTNDDLTGWGVGVLSPTAPQGKGPDRWHPRRIQVDVDGKTVYDSEQQETDRQTLAAIRLLPPAQLDLDGSVVLNPAGTRELYFWANGQTTGFDPMTGSVDKLPATTVTEGGTTVSPPEPETGGMNPIDGGGVIPPEPPEPTVPGNPEPMPQTLFPEEIPVVDPVPAPVVPGEPVPPPAVVAPPPPIIIIVGVVPQPILSPFAPIPVGPNPDPIPAAPPIVPIGNPAQVDAVRFAQLTRNGTNSTVTVTWRVTGDESALAFYAVTLIGLEDDLSSVGLAPRAGQIAFPMGIVPRGVFSITRTVPDSFLLPWKFVVPRVEARPADLAANSNSRLGPARSTATFQPNFVRATLRNAGQVQGPPLALRTRVRFAAHTAFDLFVPENNALIFPMDTQTPETTFSLRASDLAAGTRPKSVRFHAGFSGGDAPDSTVQYRVEAFATEVSTRTGGVTTTRPITVGADVTVPGETADADGFFTLKGSDMKFHEVKVRLPARLAVATVPAKRWNIELTVTLKNFTGDPARPPVIFNTTVTND